MTSTCTKCGFSDSRYINDGMAIKDYLAEIEREHLAESPDCPIAVQDLTVIDIDPDANFNLSKLARRRTVRVKLNHQPAVPGPWRE